MKRYRAVDRKGNPVLFVPATGMAWTCEGDSPEAVAVSYMDGMGARVEEVRPTVAVDAEELRDILLWLSDRDFAGPVILRMLDKASEALR